jgi:hypothetical protein
MHLDDLLAKLVGAIVASLGLSGVILSILPAATDPPPDLNKTVTIALVSLALLGFGVWILMRPTRRRK